MLHNTEKTETCHGNAQVLFVARTKTGKYLTETDFIFFLQKVGFIVSSVDWCARMRLNVRISLLERDSTTGSTLLRSHKQSMENLDATIAFSFRHSLE